MRLAPSPLQVRQKAVALSAVLLLCAACPHQDAGNRSQPAASATARPPSPPTDVVTLSILGINDLHGHIERLPVLAGYVANVRAARRQDGGAVVIVDAGDMFQGTLESNLGEGEPVIAAYNQLGVAAAAIGNHEFDYGPVGPDVAARTPGQDPRGALKRRAEQANFPLLAANILDQRTGEPIDWKGVAPSTLIEAAGVKVGIIGVATMATPHTTLAANARGLAMAPLASSIVGQARSLRQRGAQVVIVAAHAGAACDQFDDPDDLSSCDQREEMVAAIAELPAKTIDVVVAGHSHRAIAHRVHGVAVIQQYSYGRAFGRVDVRVDRASGAVVAVAPRPPRDLCSRQAPPCEPGTYEGAAVVEDQAMADLLRPAFERARALKQRPVGVVLDAPVERSYDQESALGNLFADAMLASSPKADAAITNGGGLRADLPAGALSYGALYESMPFDNMIATVTMTGSEFKRAIARNLASGGGIYSVAGVVARAGRCRGGEPAVSLMRVDRRGRPSGAIGDDEQLTVVTSDFVASTGTRVFGVVPRTANAVTVGAEMVRDRIAAYLASRRRVVAGELVAVRRLEYPGQRPLRCPR